MSIQGVSQRKAYKFVDFYTDCKNHRERVEIETDAKNDAMNVLHLFGENPLKDQILDYIVQYSPNAYEYINTEYYRKGTEKDRNYHPLVDAYRLSLKLFDLYIAFCKEKSRTGWIIKSIHSDNGHSGTGDTMSIGSYINLARNLI